MNIGFVGVGFMGKHMAINLINAGHSIKVFDINSSIVDELCELGASKANSPQEVCLETKLVFTSLPTPQIVEEVFMSEGGIFSQASPGTTMIDLSTTDPDTIKRIASQGSKINVHFLDAPVSGGTSGAENATLSIMVGGDKEKFEEFEPILNILGDKIMYCGELGSGATCKIVNNLIGMSVGVLLSEAFTLGIKSGVNPSTLYEAISKSSGNTGQMHSFPNSVFINNFDPGFKLELGAKDVGLATEMGRKTGVPMEVSNLIHQKYIEAMNKSLGKEVSLAIVKLQEEKSGVKIRYKQ
ncbi:MAG: NAD(P)-dependent oxidoreductase [Dehalococcoidia bacterium]